MANNLNLGQLIGPSKPSMTPTPLMPSVKPFAPTNNLNLGKLISGPVQPNLSPVITPKPSQQQSLEINKPVIPTNSLYMSKDRQKEILSTLQTVEDKRYALNRMAQKYIIEGFNDAPGQGVKVIGSKVTTDGGIKGQVAPNNYQQFEPRYKREEGKPLDLTKSIGNIIPSTANVGVNLLNMVANPLETAKNLLKIPAGAGVNLGQTILEKVQGEEAYQKMHNQLLEDKGIRGSIYRSMDQSGDMAKALGNYVAGYADTEERRRRIEEDPVGVFSDFVSVLGGAGSIASKVGKLGGLADTSRLMKTANLVSKADLLDPYTLGTQGAGKIGSKILDTVLPPFLGTNIRPVTPTIGGEFTIPAETIQPKVPSTKVGEVSFVDKAVGAYNGLDPETVRVMKDTPDIIKQLDEGIITKESIKNDLVGSVEQVKQQKKDVGGIYQSVYNDPTQWNTRDIIAKIENGLKEQGVKIKNNKITGFDTTKMTGLTDTSKSALKSKFEDVIGTLKDKDYINVEEYHNIRKDIYNTSYQEGFITKKAPGVNKLADIINEDLKKIPGFKEVDSGFKQASDLLEEIKSNVLDKQGDFKGTLKALLGERGQSRLAVLDKHFPGFKEKLKALAAYDDYLNTRTRKKVGLYEKAASAGPGVLAGFMTFGPIGAIVGGLASSVLKDFITDPKRFKDYIVSKAGKNLANKIELGTTLDIAEQSQFKQIINDIQKQPDLVLPLKPGATVFPGSKGQLGNTEALYKPNPSIRETGLIGQPYKKPVTPPKLPAIINKTKTDISNVLKTTPPPKLQAKPVTPTPDLPSTSTKNNIFSTFNSKQNLINKTKKEVVDTFLQQNKNAIVKQKVAIPKAPVIQSTDITTSIKKAKAEGKTFEEFVYEKKTQAYDNIIKERDTRISKIQNEIDDIEKANTRDIGVKQGESKIRQINTLKEKQSKVRLDTETKEDWLIEKEIGTTSQLKQIREQANKPNIPKAPVSNVLKPTPPPKLQAKSTIKLESEFISPVSGKVQDPMKIPYDWASYSSADKTKYMDSLNKFNKSVAPKAPIKVNTAHQIVGKQIDSIISEYRKITYKGEVDKVKKLYPNVESKLLETPGVKQYFESNGIKDSKGLISFLEKRHKAIREPIEATRKADIAQASKDRFTDGMNKALEQAGVKARLPAIVKQKVVIPKAPVKANTVPKAPVIQSTDITTSIKKAKAEGKTFDEFVKENNKIEDFTETLGDGTKVGSKVTLDDGTVVYMGKMIDGKTGPIKSEKGGKVLFDNTDTILNIQKKQLRTERDKLDKPVIPKAPVKK